MPRVTSILSKMFNVAYAVEILRISRVTSTKTIFINHCSTFICRMIIKGTSFQRPCPKRLVDTFKLLVSSLQDH